MGGCAIIGHSILLNLIKVVQNRLLPTTTAFTIGVLVSMSLIGVLEGRPIEDIQSKLDLLKLPFTVNNSSLHSCGTFYYAISLLSLLFIKQEIS